MCIATPSLPVNHLGTFHKFEKTFKFFESILTVNMPKGQSGKSPKGKSGKGGGGGKRRREEEEDPLFTPDNPPKKSKSTKDPAQDPALEEEEEEEEEPIVEAQPGTSTGGETTTVPSVIVVEGPEEECNGHRIFPFVKDRSFYPTHDPPLYSEQQRGML